MQCNIIYLYHRNINNIMKYKITQYIIINRIIINIIITIDNSTKIQILLFYMHRWETRGDAIEKEKMAAISERAGFGSQLRSP